MVQAYYKNPYLFALGNWSKKILLSLMSENVLPTFFSRSFMVSCLMFKQFDFIFVYSIRVYSNIIDLHVAVQLSKKTVFSLLYILAPFIKG